MSPYESEEESQPYDNHSGSRLVLLLFMLPLSFIVGWVAWTVVRQLAEAPLGYIAAQRLAIVAGGVAMIVTMVALLRWQYALSPKSQAEAEEEIDTMDDDEEDEDDD